MSNKENIKIVARNKKAFHDYHIEETYEAGIELSGTEVKSIRKGSINLKESYITVRGGQMWIIGAHISPFEQGNRSNKDPLRDRKLLMHKREIMRLYGVMKRDGLTLVPTKCYFKNNLVKIEVGVARGKKLHDKREDVAKKQMEREMQRKVKTSRYDN